MKRMYALAAAAVLAATVAATASAAASVDVQISVGQRYNGATLAFQSAPRVVLVPQTKVYYVQDRDVDLYRYGSYWYFVEDGYWYRSSSWQGPFVHLRSGSVPRTVVTVPVKYRRHWKNGPPSHAVAQGYYKDKNRGPSRDRGPNRDRDQGRGHSEKGHKH